jgi:RNA polymerase sigma factor (sigma-70 family)
VWVWQRTCGASQQSEPAITLAALFSEDSPKKPDVPDVSPSESASGNAGNMPATREQFIEQALAQYESPLVGYAMGFLKDVERSRDVVQDTFLRLCQQDVAKVRDGLKTWLFTVCRNRALDVLRKDRRIEGMDEVKWKRVAGSEVPPDEMLQQNERIRQVHRALSRLSGNQREVILLKFQQGLSYREISDVTGLGGGNVGYLIHTGLKRARELLPPDFFDTNDQFHENDPR